MTPQKTFKLGNIEVPINTRKSDYIPDSSLYLVDPKEQGFAERILLGIKKNLPALLIGPTGCGKTATIKWLAEKTNNGYRRIQLNGSTNIDSFVGRWLINSEGTYWVDGILTEAMRKGLWLICDEINAALPEILFVLHSVMDDDKMLVIDEKDGEIVKPHPDFRLFAAMNPSESYVGTKELNRALIDRFPIVLNVNYPDAKQEEKIIIKHTGIDTKWGKSVGGKKSIVKRMVEFANVIRKKVDSDEMLFGCSTRQLIYWSSLSMEIGVKQGAEIAIINKADKEDQKKLKDEINKFFKDDEDTMDMGKFDVKTEDDVITNHKTKAKVVSGKKIVLPADDPSSKSTDEKRRKILKQAMDQAKATSGSVATSHEIEEEELASDCPF